MPRETLDRQIQQLQDELFVLGSMVEQAVLSAVEALQRRDLLAAKRIIRKDHTINEKRYAIENAILILIATQQPMARDLRLLAALLEVINELERMGDYAKGIAKVIILQDGEPFSLGLQSFARMAELALNMLHRALSAFVDRNSQEAAQIAREDDLVDQYYNEIHGDLINTMITNPATINQANRLLWVAHNLERMADRVTNICERTVFIATGELIEFDQEDEEEKIT